MKLCEDQAAYEHGAVMHLDLARDLIRSYSRSGDLVLDVPPVPARQVLRCRRLVVSTSCSSHGTKQWTRTKTTGEYDS